MKTSDEELQYATSNVESDKRTSNVESDKRIHTVGNPPPKSMIECIGRSLNDTFFPLRHLKNQTPKRKCLLGFQYVFPILEWFPRYSFTLLKSDFISGITIASLAIPQGISYAKLANLPPTIGLYSSFVPPLVYATLGSSKDLAVGTVSVVSLIMGSMISSEVSPTENPILYLHLIFTATFFAGVFQASLGIFRLGFITDFLSHATIIGFMAGAAVVIALQQLRSILGLHQFTKHTDIISVLHSVFSQNKEWRWQSILLGAIFLIFLVITRLIGKKKPKLFWISAAAPLVSVIASSLFVFLTHAENHGISIVGGLKKGLNPLSARHLIFQKQYLSIALKTGAISGIISLAEGIAVGRTFSSIKKYEVDGNKEMFAFGIMNIAGSCTSCYVTTGAFSRTAVNFNAGCKTAVSNIIMAITVMLVLLFFISLLHYTPLTILSVIIVSAMFGLIDIQAFRHLWKVDKLDLLVSMGAFCGVVFISVEIGLIVAVTISMLRVILHGARPKVTRLGKIPETSIFRNTEQYKEATSIPGILIFQLESPVYFTNSGYIRERIKRQVEDEEMKLAKLKKCNLQYVILELSAVSCVDSTGINMLHEMAKYLEARNLQLCLANPLVDVMETFKKSRFVDVVGQKWFFINVSEAVEVCKCLQHDL